MSFIFKVSTFLRTCDYMINIDYIYKYNRINNYNRQATRKICTSTISTNIDHSNCHYTTDLKHEKKEWQC